MIWEALSLSRLQKDIKMRGFPARKACSGEKAKGVPEPPLAGIAEGPRVRAFSHTEGAGRQ